MLYKKNKLKFILSLMAAGSVLNGAQRPELVQEGNGALDQLDPGPQALVQSYLGLSDQVKLATTQVAFRNLMLDKINALADFVASHRFPSSASGHPFRNIPITQPDYCKVLLMAERYNISPEDLLKGAGIMSVSRAGVISFADVLRVSSVLLEQSAQLSALIPGIVEALNNFEGPADQAEYFPEIIQALTAISWSPSEIFLYRCNADAYHRIPTGHDFYFLPCELRNAAGNLILRGLILTVRPESITLGVHAMDSRNIGLDLMNRGDGIALSMPDSPISLQMPGHLDTDSMLLPEDIAAWIAAHSRIY